MYPYSKFLGRSGELVGANVLRRVSRGNLKVGWLADQAACYYGLHFQLTRVASTVYWYFASLLLLLNYLINVKLEIFSGREYQ